MIQDKQHRLRPGVAGFCRDKGWRVRVLALVLLSLPAQAQQPAAPT